uniref:rRNA-processing protein FYV7 n=1 Tax=Mayetiola destructor TaxID=39758 RepID=D1MLP1_MAYDE|nr:hypothetical protein [Mayetiola destructor]
MKNDKKSGKPKPTGGPSLKKVQKKPQFKPSHPKSNTNSNNNNKKRNKSGKNQFKIAEERRLDRIREKNEQKAEKEAKILLAKKEKKRKMKILLKKTGRGQPMMGGRMELLLEKIQKRTGRS